MKLLSTQTHGIIDYLTAGGVERVEEGMRNG